jgi:GTP-binding protein
MSRLPTVAIVGFPNVGKSTLVNRLAGGREAVTDAQPGVTRDRKRVRCEWNGVAFELLDTGGVDLADDDELARDIQRQARLGMEEADLVMLVADARAGVRAGDAELAAVLRRAEVPVLVVANKVDRPSSTASASASPRPSRRPTASAPATCSTASLSCSGTRPPPPRRTRRPVLR